jgi:hypothetical protein
MPLTKATQNVITPNICTTDTIQTITGTKTFSQPTNFTGNVGIGTTTTTTEKLEVSGNIKASDSLFSKGLFATNTTGDAVIQVSSNTNAYIDLSLPTSDDNDIRIGTQGTGGYISTSGNGNIHLAPGGTGKVGIGQPIPTEKLEVSGNIKVSGSGNFQTIEVGNTSPGVPFIDIKSPTTDDYDLRLTTDGTNGIIRSFGNIYLEPAPFKAIIILEIGTYANNADAVAGGLLVNSVYKTVTGELRIVV